MATAAFRSTTTRRRTEDAGSSNRRSRSLSRYSGRFPPPSPAESDDFSTPRGRFVNKSRGSGFPEISLDDIADEFFRDKEEAEAEAEAEEEDIAKVDRGRRRSDFVSRMEMDSSRRRGRSVVRTTNNGNGHGKENNNNNGAAAAGGSRLQRRSLSVARRTNSTTTHLQDGKDTYLPTQRCENQSSAEGNAHHHGNDRSSRRRSLSVARYPHNDLESDMDRFHGTCRSRSFNKVKSQQPSSNNLTKTSHVLRRSMSQKDLLQSLDNYSSHSSSLTDDEAHDIHSIKSGTEKTIRAVYAPEKAEHPTEDGDGSGLFEAMRSEVRHAVKEIRTELEKVMVKTEPTMLANSVFDQPKKSNPVTVIADIRRNYTSKLEQSEKRKHDLLAELAAEEQRGQELTNIVRELLPAPKQIATPERPSRSRRRSNDKTRMSKCLFQEAERYFEDFLSNVEDTDISSFDGERSDTSSTFGGNTKLKEPAVHKAMSETHAILAKATALPDETDGVILPWLQWETSNDASPSPCKSNAGVPAVLGTAAQEASATCNNDINPRSSFGSWSPKDSDSSSATSSQPTGSRIEKGQSHRMSSSFHSAIGNPMKSSFDMDEYLDLHRNEDLLLEMWRQRQRIESGSLILCGRVLH